jgi:hypothetical protein
MGRERDPEFIAQQWVVRVADGNNDNWLTIHPDAPVGPLRSWRLGMTPAIGRDIVRVLRAAADLLEAQVAKMPSKTGEVVPFKPNPDNKQE